MTATRRTLDLAISEAEWQRTVTELATTLGWAWYHTHDSRRSPAGFPDLVLVRDRVLFAELKTERGPVTKEQRRWMTLLNQAWTPCYIWRPSDWPEVERTLRERRSNIRTETGSDLVESGRSERPRGAANARGHGRPDGEEWST